MQFDQAVKTCFRKYAVFRGRASRSEYWWWTLFVMIITLLAMLIDGFFVAPMLGFAQFSFADGSPVATFAHLAFLLPSLAVGARRLHDTNRTAWWLLVIIIPILGAFILLYFFVQPSTQGATSYEA